MERSSDTADTASELYLVVVQLVRRFRVDLPLPLAQASALGWLARQGARTTSQLAVLERVRPQSMAQTVHELETAGFIVRHPDPADRRQTLIELTEQGRRTLDDYRRSRASWLAKTIAEQFDAEERATLARSVALLRLLADA
jgi:DNA-binding MarR family transcriptional regulator